MVLISCLCLWSELSRCLLRLVVGWMLFDFSSMLMLASSGSDSSAVVFVPLSITGGLVGNLLERCCLNARSSSRFFTVSSLPFDFDWSLFKRKVQI